MTGEQLENGEDGMRVELKYCERCGVLWLRDPSGGQVYCGDCGPRMDELPVQKKRPTLRHGRFSICPANAMTMPVAGGAV